MLLDVADRLQRLWLRTRGFRVRHLPTSVGRVHALDAVGRGDGPPVVVIHGISAAAVHFTPVLPRLLPRVRRVIAPDLPGHGFSDVPEVGLRDGLEPGLVEALDQLLDEPAVVFGNSLGGLAAIRYAQKRPEKVRSLVLCSPGGAMQDQQALARFLQSFRMDDHPAAVDFLERLYAFPPAYARWIASGVRDRFHAPHLRELLDEIGPADLLTPADLAGLAMPILVVWGKRDRLMPREHVEFFRRHLPRHANWDEPDDFGHCPNLDRPRALAERIAAFACAT